MDDDQLSEDEKHLLLHSLPAFLQNAFQVMLIVEKIIGFGIFSGISWWQVFIPLYVRLGFALFWPIKK